jgi:hypothetical protein
MMSNERFLVIKAWGAGFWSDMDDLQTKLMLAEVANRQPVVYWGSNSRYSVDNVVEEQVNFFAKYYQPVSNFTVTELLKEEYTYYPLHWNYANIYPDNGLIRRNRYNRDIANFVMSDAQVAVSDVHNFMHELIPWIPANHPVYGLVGELRDEPLPQSFDDAFYERVRRTDKVNRYIINKYLKLQPEVSNEIEAFYNANLKNGPVLAVHVRFDLETVGQWRDSLKINLIDLNEQYFAKIDQYLQANPKSRLFLMTANQRVLDRYLQKYGDILIYTDCQRGDEHTTIYQKSQRLGIEIIKDTYLACKCDHFIGLKYSNVTWAVRRLKEWDEGTIELIG